ncbi:MAG: winged helix-turn-helix domain-containing protein [Gammaproteobacteria bacterium]|nr:winged helix-turn-helix domain-containing protein [Gammaproteobacteria bacterium]
MRKGFQLGDWQVLPDRGLLRQGDTELHVEPLPMDVLVVLASQQGDVVSKDQLVEAVWHGRPVSDEVITRCISVIRRSLGDDAKAPVFVENVPRRGYRLKLPITVSGSAESQHEVPVVAAQTAYVWPLIGGFAALLVVVGFALFYQRWQDDAIRSVVVFPFQCDVEKEHLCFGFSEALTSTLFRLEGLRVVKSREPFEKGKKTRDIIDEFKVDAVVEGKVRYDGHRFTVVADLIDGRNAKVLFSNVYDGGEETIFDLQEKVAADVRDRLTGKTGASHVVATRPASFAVFDKYSEGLYEFEKRSVASIRQAITLFQETIELDPKFGTAYFMLSYAYALLPEYADEAQDAMYVRALEVAAQGVRMDPSIADATATVDAFIAHKRGEWIVAESGYQRALRSDIVYPLTHQLYSRLLASVGRLDASLEQAKRARELDPQSAVLISRLAMAHFWVGNLEDAERLFARAHGMNLQSPIQDLAYALFKINQGRVDEARQLAKDGLNKYGADSRWVDPVFDGIDDPSKYDASHSLVGEMSAGGLLPPRVEITLWAILRDADRAMQVARRLRSEGEVFEAELLFIPQFRLIREHPEFPALMDAIGLTEYWNSVGCRWEDDAVRCNATGTR